MSRFRSQEPSASEISEEVPAAPIPVLKAIDRKEPTDEQTPFVARDFAYRFDDFLFWGQMDHTDVLTALDDEEEDAGSSRHGAEQIVEEHDGFKGAPPWLQSSQDGALSEEDLPLQAHDDELHGRAVALFDFDPEHENEFALVEGQIIYISSRHNLGWLVAVDIATGDCGLVPEEYVRLLEEDEEGFLGEDLRGERTVSSAVSDRKRTSGSSKRSGEQAPDSDHNEWVDEPDDSKTEPIETEDQASAPQNDPSELTDEERQAIFDAAEREMRLNDARFRES